MDSKTLTLSPKEEGELEDGEICDDEPEERASVAVGSGRRPGGGGPPPRARKPHQHSHNMLPLMAVQTHDFRRRLPYNVGPHGHDPFGPGHRPQCGPSGPERPPAPPPVPPPLPGLGPLCENSPRSSFWERSHGALGRFRHRAMPNVGRGGWNRGNWGDGNARALPGRYGPGESHIMDSPPRKPKQLGRNQARKPLYVAAKSESSVDETFEDLLSKYKQIQLELECIRKEESMVLEPKGSSVTDEPCENAASISESSTVTETVADQIPVAAEEIPELDMAQKKVFLAFNIKPLRQKLLTPSDLDEMTITCVEQDKSGDGDSKDGETKTTQEGQEMEQKTNTEVGNSSVVEPCVCCSEGTEKRGKGKAKKLITASSESSGHSEDSVSADKTGAKVEEEELSELQLRLLALQSASKKWQQKEQQVMKKGKERISKGPQEKSAGSGPSATSPARQRVTTRSASSAAAAAAATEWNRNRSKPQERERDRPKLGPKSGARPPERDRERPNTLERERFKPGKKPPPERGRTPAKPYLAKMMNTREKCSAAKQAFRKQQLRTWKLQQQQEQEEKRRQEEEERRKREEEIRRIRDLSNQDEQYNRFMKLVGGKMQTLSKCRDREHRKSTGKQGLDTSGNLYQYDNYDEVAMDTDSETSSPVLSPQHPFAVEVPGCFPQMPLCMVDPSHFGMDFVQPFMPHMVSGLPPPPPPLPPPPDELEPPPKPPFADEEEEEEMQLRETCLMSMASKRVSATEDKTSSGPPSPSFQAVSIQPQPRVNLSTVCLNTVPQPRTNKFTRGHHLPRPPLVLPKHKSVVVSLNDSEDSDSDIDTSSSMQASVFGGLEFMIKEARRTVEAAKPKTASEKENNPLRTPEDLPEAKKAEYRLLKEEIISREKQKTLKDHTQSSFSAALSTLSSSVLDSSAKTAAEVTLTEAEEKLNKHRNLLQKDEAILRQLLQQELKKRESLKMAEAKVVRLREQLQASEKIVSANKILLKKLQEQMHHVEHRVSVKRSLSAKLEKELAQAQLAAGRGSKRKQDFTQHIPNKLRSVDGAPRASDHHFARLIAQKQRLQQLESEYALKIQKLKEAQVLRNRGAAPELSVEQPLRASTPPDLQNQLPHDASPFPLPQPSLHDLTQDKLTLDSEDITESEDHEPESTPVPVTTKGTRRHSFHQSNSSTKPNLEQLGASQVKEISTLKPAKTLNTSLGSSEVFAGLDMDALKQRYHQQPRLGHLLLRELQKVGETLQPPPYGKVTPLELDSATNQSVASEEKPVAFEPYHSPLLVFKSYRFSPYYRTKEKLSLRSVTYSNAIDSKKSFCRFDLTGTCNDDDCRWQHMRNCTLVGNQLFHDVLSYNLSLIGCTEMSSDEEVSIATEKYIKKLFGANKDRMGIDQKAVLLVSKVNESKRHVPPYTTFKEMRKWKPKPSLQTNVSPEDNSEDETTDNHQMTGKFDDCSKTSLSALDVCITSDDKRYFISETDDISNLETSVLENPCDTQLWIKLAFRYLSQNDTSASDCLEAALNTLSRALENNCDNPEVWSHYLMLFSKRGSKEEVQEMCEMAVEHAPDYQVWWSFLKLESSFEGKDYVCDRLLQFLLTEATSGVTDQLSFQLMEALLYRVDLSLFTGRMESALAILQNALKSAHDRSIADHLTASNRALVWLSYIHLTEFDRLPVSLYDPGNSNPSRLVSTEPFLLPWQTSQDISTPLDILIALFKDAIHQCSDETLPQSERTLACLPLHTNLIFLNKLLERYDEGILMCESLLEFCPESCTLRDDLADLYIRKGSGDQAVSMWLHALAECPNNAEVFYHSCKFLVAQDKSGAIAPLFRGFILSLCEDEQSQQKPVDVLRHILGFPTEGILQGSIVKKELKEQLSQQMPYLHLVHCQWQWLHGTVQETVDAFERALGTPMQLDILHKLWLAYLFFSSCQQARGPSSRQLSDLIQRCLSTVPSRLEVPFNPAEYWSCYCFHNKVVAFYLSCLPESQHALVLERLRNAMPNNTDLGLRLVHQEWQDGIIEHLKFQARILSSSSPKCLASWKIVIAVEKELKERSEVRLLYQQALQNLPLCADLWKDRLLFEAAEGGKTDKLRKLVEKCQEVGVSLSEPLNLGLGRAQEDKR